jgi:putative methyltransferase (TIGR04325 family)
VLLAVQRRVPQVKPFLAMLGRVPGIDEALVGHRRGFRSREAAESRVRREGSIGHADARAIALHRTFEEELRPSDHDAIEQIGPLLPELRRVVDIGGSVGNVYYLYGRHLELPAALEWVVCELPESVRHGRALAAERGVTQLRFEQGLARCGPAELALFSGSLHYLEQPASVLLAELGALPRYVLINRSPVTEAAPMYAVQDAGEWFTAAKVLQRSELVEDLERAGYRLRAEWACYELNVRFPLHPQHSAEHYSGFLFERAV